MMDPGFSTRVVTAIEIARAAGVVLRRWYEQDSAADEVHFKGPTDLQTAADRESEVLILRALAEAFPDDAVFAEESGGRPAAGAPCWYVAPLDGTTNFVHRDPMFAVSLGYARDDDALYVAERDRDAWVSSGVAGWRRLSVSRVAKIGHALVATGTPVDIGTTGRNAPEIIGMLRATRDLRIHGSAALNLAYVASGRLEAFWEPGLREWDVAAGVSLVLEAGGRVTDLAGARFRLGEDLVASNGILHETVCGILKRATVRP